MNERTSLGSCWPEPRSTSWTMGGTADASGEAAAPVGVAVARAMDDAAGSATREIRRFFSASAHDAHVPPPGVWLPQSHFRASTSEEGCGAATGFATEMRAITA